MAKGNLILGTLRGKLGDVVAYRSLGKQMARVRVRTVKNPKTQLQTLQRIVLSTAAKTVAVLDPIVNHSYQSVAYGAASKRYSRAQIMKVLREQMVAAYNDESRLTAAQQVGCFPSYAAGAAVAPYLISQGSIPAPVFTCEASKGGAYGGYIANFEPSATTAVQDLLNALGASIGDQITFVFLTPKEVGEHENGSKFYAADMRVARLNFKADAANEPVFSTGSGEDGAPFLIDASRLDTQRSTNYANLLFYGANVETGAIAYKYGDTTGAENNTVGGFAVILSRYGEDKWLRSTARIAVPYPVDVADAPDAQPGIGFNFFEEVLESGIDEQAVAEDRYLNKEKN